MTKPTPAIISQETARNRANMAKDETEIVNPQVGGKAFELLRAYHIKEWRDTDGWHVIVATSRLPEIAAAERERQAAISRASGQPVDVASGDRPDTDAQTS